jgi:hypothetical protein
MSGEGRLPEFIIIGAVKGATTWIHHQLQAHPDIFLPDPEPHFFSKDYDLGIEHYRRLFKDASPSEMIGEKSADYLAHPLAAARMAQVLPDVPMVVQLRNPVDRAYSDYKMLYRRGTVKGSPEDYLHPESEQPRFVQDGLYAEHLMRWYDHFDRRQIKVLLFEDVLQSPEETVASVCKHIGAKPHFSTERGTRSVNDASAKFLPLPVRTALEPLKVAVKPLRGNRLFEGVRALMAREVAYPPMQPATRARLVDFYARDVEKLSALIGRDLDHWLVPRKLAA